MFKSTQNFIKSGLTSILYKTISKNKTVIQNYRKFRRGEFLILNIYYNSKINPHEVSLYTNVDETERIPGL
jgi:hypothetical protein